MAAIAPPISPRPGFGEYTLPEQRTFAQVQSASKAQKIALTILFSVFAIASLVILTPASIPFGLLTAGLLFYLAAQTILQLVGVANRAPPLQELFPPEQTQRLGEIAPETLEGFATKDGPDSHKWRLDLIRSAQSSILLSGCYFGGDSFNEMLDVIRERMHEAPQLKTSLLCSTTYLTNNNREKIKELEAEFRDRFETLIAPEVFPYLAPSTERLSFTTNHTKALVIDYGAYFMVGGSGVVDGWTRQRGDATPRNVSNNRVSLARLMQFEAFRDMDFVFHSPRPAPRIYTEMSHLFERMRHQAGHPIRLPEPGRPQSIDPLCSAFANEPSRLENLRAALYVSGPEQTRNLFLKEMIQQIETAKKTIVIAHMYFHPPKALSDALIAASNRGVEITLITNGQGKKAPRHHRLYGEYSRLHFQKLFEGRIKPNVRVYEFGVTRTNLHKKTIVIDGKTSLIGSSNVNFKSLEGHDYELDFKIESEAFAEQILAATERDIALSHRIPDEAAPRISFKTRIAAAFQSLGKAYL